MPMIIKFYTKSCGPCKMVTNALDELEVTYEEVDIEEDMQSAIDNRVSSVPTLINTETGSRIIGFKNKQKIQEWLNGNPS